MLPVFCVVARSTRDCAAESNCMVWQKSRRNKQKKTTVQDLQPNTLPTSSKPEAIPPNDQLEAVAVLVLVSLFIAIIGQGLFLAVSVSPALHSHGWHLVFGFNLNAYMLAMLAGLSA